MDFGCIFLGFLYRTIFAKESIKVLYFSVNSGLFLIRYHNEANPYAGLCGGNKMLQIYTVKSKMLDKQALASHTLKFVNELGEITKVGVLVFYPMERVAVTAEVQYWKNNNVFCAFKWYKSVCSTSIEVTWDYSGGYIESASSCYTDKMKVWFFDYKDRALSYEGKSKPYKQYASGGKKLVGVQTEGNVNMDVPDYYYSYTGLPSEQNVNYKLAVVCTEPPIFRMPPKTAKWQPGVYTCHLTGETV